jgi:CheY-like chemotaxis protein
LNPLRSSHAHSSPGDSRRILAVDDDRLIVHILKHVLNLLGFEVIAVTSSIKALEIFTNTPNDYDLIITDQIMPDMLGLELSRKIRMIRPDIPIILISGNLGGCTQKQIEDADIFAYLPKPFSLTDLTQQVIASQNGGSEHRATL